MIAFLKNDLRPTPAPRPMPSPRPIPAPRPTPAPRPIPALRLKPTPSIRSRQLNSQNSRPYQLKLKRGKETFIELKELPPSNLKQIKCIKKKLGKLNKKIRHSKKDHNSLISKQNSIKNRTEELKELRKPKELHEPEDSFNPIELEQALNRAYNRA